MTAKYDEGRVSINTVVTKKENAVPTPGNTKATAALPQTYRKRVGSTVYVVKVHFSQTSQETAEDKLLRLIKREVENIA